MIKDARLDIRLTAEHKSRLLEASHEFRSSLSSRVLFGIDNEFVQAYIMKADYYLALMKAAPEGELRDLLAQKHHDAVEAARYFNEQAKAAHELTQAYKEEAQEAYKESMHVMEATQ
jgi:hypothetical protein